MLYEEDTTRTVAQDLNEPTDKRLIMRWLGQAGFALRVREGCLLIDPYLSDHLAEKYRDSVFPHERLMPAPLGVSELTRVDWVLCTHRHSDHMDPQTLRALAERFPDASFILPAAETAHAVDAIGLPADRLYPVQADQRVQLSSDLALSVLPAAHESLEVDEQGQHRFVGYVLEIAGLRLYHSGDCIPYDGLLSRVEAARPDVALLPVNGRKPELQRAGIAGNFNIAEALELCAQANIPTLIAHHYGMFAFNTASTEALEQAAADQRQAPRLIRARLQVAYHAD